MSSKSALILLYPDNIELEFCIPLAVLKKGGVRVTLAGPNSEPVTGSQGMKIIPEMDLAEAMAKGPYDVVVVAGGRDGWKTLSADERVGELLRGQELSGRLISAICTAPIVLKSHKVMYGKKLTSYPLVEEIVREGDKYVYKYDDVVVDGNLITSKGNYTTFHWALKTLEVLTNRDRAAEVAKEMLISY